MARIAGVNERANGFNLRVHADTNRDRRRPDIAGWASERFRKLSPEQVREFRRLREAGVGVRALARQAGCSPATMSYALNGKGLCYAGE